MEVELTRMSPNGQVVIPSQIRKAARIAPNDRFMVLCENDAIILKKLTRKDFAKDLTLLGRIAEAEEHVRKGEVLTLPGNLSSKEMMRRVAEYGRRCNAEVRKKSGKAR